MGAVYEAIDLRLGHTVALKQSLTDSESLTRQFEREARLLAQLNHPVLPRVTDYFADNGRAFLVMQFIAGDDLATLLAQQTGPLPRHSVIAWADQLLDAIIYLHTHDRQVIHRDIKPHNLKVTPDGKIALLDFGLAKSQACDDETSGQSVFGFSPQYAPLEQIQDTGTGPHSDIYALGATLYHLLTGVKPADAVTRATALKDSQPNPLRPAHEINSAVELELSMILNRAMAYDAAERFQTADEFRQALRRLGRVDSQDNQDMQNNALTEPALVHRKSSRAFAATMIILLASFAVFCRYYQWRMPALENQSAAKLVTNDAVERTDLPKYFGDSASSRHQTPQKILKHKRRSR
jgi:serine/threonine protein kinase